MKKIIFPLLAVMAVFFTSCNPNEQVYQHLDSLRTPYSEHFEYKLTDDDYTTMKTLALQDAQNAQDTTDANFLGSNHVFTDSIAPADYIPGLFASKFLALDSGSAIVAVYNVSHRYFIPNDCIYNSGDTAVLGQPDDYSSYITMENPAENAKAVVSYKGAKYADDTTYETAYALYVYTNGTWVRPANTYELTKNDYSDMGVGNNFTTDITPEFYMPIFLKQKYPYATPGTTLSIVYKYCVCSESKTYISYDYWYFDGTDWSNLEKKSEQYIHNGTKWVFDPTVKITMGFDEYQAIVDWVISQDSIKDYAPYSNTEYYFGASTYHDYNDFDMRTTSRANHDPNGYLAGLSDDEISSVIWSRIPQAINIALEAVYPDAVPFVNGVPVYYEVTFKTYEPGYFYYMIKFLCTDVGKFEYVEGPTPVQ